jgi:hypothetical protein
MNARVVVLALACVLAGGCVPDTPLSLEARQEATGVQVVASRPVTEIRLVGADGRTHARREMATPSTTAWLPVLAPAGDYTLLVRAGKEEAGAGLRLSPPSPVAVSVEAPFGQGHRAIGGGEGVLLPMVRGQSATFGVDLLAGVAPVTVRIDVGTDHRELELDAPGQQRSELFRVLDGAADLPVHVAMDGAFAGDQDFVLRVLPVDPETASAELHLVESVFPSDASGRSDLARPEGLVTLPSRSWRTLLRLADLGTRPRSDQSPWAFEAATIRNDGPTDANLVLRFGVVDASGKPVHAFRPRLREANGAIDTVDALLRVPARGEATAVLPLYVDDQDPALAGDAHPAWFRVIEALPMGSVAPLWAEREPLFARRGSAWATLGILAGCVGAVGGLALVFTRFASWTRRFGTSELVSIALFGTLNFVTGTAAWLLGMATGTLLGPFAPLVTGVLDDTFRTVLLATLVTLIPRPGTAALSLLVGYLLRGLALGSFHPVDLLSLGSTILFLETALFFFGLTRGSGAWREQPRFWRWIRLSCGFGLPAALTMLVSLAVAVVFYRLFYSDLYVALMVGLPGFAYVVAACGMAVGFAESLRRVES